HQGEADEHPLPHAGLGRKVVRYAVDLGRHLVAQLLVATPVGGGERRGELVDGDRLPAHGPLDQAGEAHVELGGVGVGDHLVVGGLGGQQGLVVLVPQHLAGGGLVDLVAVVDAPVQGPDDEVHAGHVHEQLDGAAGHVDEL